MTQICVSKLTIIASDNGLSPGRRQAIIWTIAGILLIRTLEKKFSEILSEIHTFWFIKMHLKMSSAKCQQFYLGLNVLMRIHTRQCLYTPIIKYQWWCVTQYLFNPHILWIGVDCLGISNWCKLRHVWTLSAADTITAVLRRSVCDTPV